MNFTSETLTIIDISTNGVVARDSRGGTHIIDPRIGVLGKEIRRGDIWTASAVGYGVYALTDRVEAGKIKIVRYSLVADAKTLIGSEKQFVDDAVSLGVDSVMLIVGDGGTVYWDFPEADSVGLSVGADVVGSIMSRLSVAGIGATLLIPFSLWGEGGDYNQSFIGGGRSPLLSPVLAEEPLRMVFQSLNATFPSSYGVGFYGARLDGIDADSSPDVVSLFSTEYGVTKPSSSYIGISDPSIPEVKLWRSFRSSLIPKLCKSLGARVALVDSGIASDLSVDPMMEYGVSEDSATAAGGTVFICTIDPDVSSSRAESMGSTLFQVSVASRMSGTSVMVGVPVGTELVSGILDAVLDSRVPNIVMNNYDLYRSMSVVDKASISDAISTNRILGDTDKPVVGVYLDRDSCFSYGHPNLDTVQRIVVDIATQNSMSIRIYAGADLPSAGEVACFLLFDSRILSDDSITHYADMVDSGLLNLVITGMCGYNDGTTVRTSLPMPSVFGGVYEGQYELAEGTLVHVATTQSESLSGMPATAYGEHRNDDYGTETGLALQDVSGVQSLLVADGGVVPILLEKNGSYLLGITFSDSPQLETLLVDLLKGASSR